ncbi:RNA 2',3'-cyclic phosphodiesterase [Rhodoferax ferrireducens]|uniref:RNA 2',3'-cyclic phosphodiesterase n=1 Tax=Rhodoferax ferrireducens TaxID=192843 RepID=UPI000E0E0514|nr:RNA 2',3'-cyclic phosphodiesterase [Rhodoferax ferrireducens]
MPKTPSSVPLKKPETARVHLSPTSGTARLFLALMPGEAMKAGLAKHCEQWHWPADAARYAPVDWHITLHFMGSVPHQRLDELRAGLAVPFTPFDLRLGLPELWPHGLAVLCPEAVPEALQHLYADLGYAVLGLGLRTDPRRFRPHLTLARHAAQARAPLLHPALDWQVEAYVLMASTGDVRQRYRVLQRYGDTGAKSRHLF